MSEPFKGRVNVDIRDSVPDWSPVETPNIDRIARVAVDVSGEPYLDLEREAAAMLARE